MRNRAYTQRGKVEEIYRTGLARGFVRIEFVKGSYVPRFVAAVPEPIETLIIPAKAVAAPAPAANREVRPWWAFGLGLIVAGIGGDAGKRYWPGAARGVGAAALSFVRDAPGFLAERLVPLAVMRRRNVVLLGGPRIPRRWCIG